MHKVGKVIKVTTLGLLVLLLVSCGGAAPVSEANNDSNSIDTTAANSSQKTVQQIFGGGPIGGTLQTFAETMSLIIADADPTLDILAQGTSGSEGNLREVNANNAQYGIVYAGDVYLGARGQLSENEPPYISARPVAALYGGVIQLVVSEASGIQSVADLPGKRIAPGTAGSVGARSAERYFERLELWDQINIESLGYPQAALALSEGQIDGFWVLAAFPNSSVAEAATMTKIRLIDTDTPAKEKGIYQVLPFYTPRVLPGGVYQGVTTDVSSFQDNALWVANKDVPDELIYNALVAVFSEEGIKRLIEAHPVAAEMTIEHALDGIFVPIHPGAAKFWQEQGLKIPENIMPQ